jgi:hypothetical protein
VTHATDDALDADRTLCGLPVRAVDNANPTCKRCLRVIRSRCDEHNVRRCRVCV